MALLKKEHARLLCPKKSNSFGSKTKRRWLFWMFPIAGFLSLLWFLIRVVPKPSRATYPCQRAAAPMAGGFLIWIAGVIASTFAYRKAKELFKKSQLALACGCLAIAALMAVIALINMPERMLLADPPNPNNPIGVAKGINPGRVVWVHDPEATNWNGPGDGHWWESDHTDQTVVDQMMYRAIRQLTGEANDAEAWDALFRHFNQTHGKGDVGYAAGEKIAIKVNFVGCIDSGGGGGVNPNTYDLESKMDYMNTSPQMMLALLRQLVYEAGVDPANISIGDPVCLFPNQYYNPLHDEFPEVHYLDARGWFNRTAVQKSSVNFYWSFHPGGVLQDKVLLSFAEADYFINMANLKSHTGGGITLCGKNYYGWLRLPPESGYYDMHASLPQYVTNYGRYRCIVDLMGHADSGGKALLYLIDGLYAGVHPIEEAPREWHTCPPFNSHEDWTSSLFVSQDPVAIDSVGFDFLWTEWNDYPHMSGADDYMTEAALANAPPSGTFYDPNNAGDVNRLASLGTHEHWNDATNKQYSRNLGTGNGIEFIPCSGTETIDETLNVKLAGAMTITIDGDPSDWNLSEFTTYSRGGQHEIGDIGQVGWLGGNMYYGQLCMEPGYVLPVDATDHTVRFYSRHDAAYQYFLVRSDDDDIQHPYGVGENWRNDCVEFFIDPGHSGDTTRMWDYDSTSCFELVIDVINQQNVYMTTSDYRLQVLSGVSSATSEDATGWWLEVRISKNVTNPLLPSGGTFGINIDFRDQDAPNATLYGWTPDYTGSGGFPSKIPANWGDAYNPRLAIAPEIAEVTPDPDTTVEGTEYTKQLTLIQGTPPIDWSVIQGPAGLAVAGTGYVSNWIPGPEDCGQTFTIEIEARNPTGSDTESWQVYVQSSCIYADFDGDDDVDQEDFGHLQACYTQTEIPYGPECQDADLNHDNTIIDLDDFAIFNACLGGANQPLGC